MPGQDVQNRIAEELSAIQELARAELVARWEKTHDQPPPKGISRRLLEYNAAYQAQAKVFGRLKPNVRRKLRSRQGKTNAKPSATTSPSRKSNALSSGTRLIREWHGRTYEVEVHDDGLEYEGKVYASLSKIAREITGARWSGPRFFGL